MKVRGSVALFGFVCLTMFSLQPALAQLRQQGSKLVGTGALGIPAQGFSVALSGDGNTAIIGGFGDNGQVGAAWVWTRSGAVWTQQQKLVSVDAFGSEAQGYSVSLSSDGNTAIVGEPHDNSDSGAALVWTRNGGVWTQQAKLAGSGSVAGNEGASVYLSADGNTAIIGGPGDNQGAGAAWVFTRNGGVWTQQGNKLVGSGAVAPSLAGSSVSLSADGNTAIIGGYNDNFTVGAAWVWIRSGGLWTQQGSKLVGSGAVGNAIQGHSVSLSADGNTAIIGGPLDNQTAGAAWVWTRSGGFWSQQSKLIGSGAVGVADQGWAVSLSADGNTAVVGGPGDNQLGAAWMWTRNGGLWSQSDKLVGSGAVGNAAQGISVCLSADGTTAILGGAEDAAETGAAWVFASVAQRRRAVRH